MHKNNSKSSFYEKIIIIISMPAHILILYYSIIGLLIFDKTKLTWHMIFSFLSIKMFAHCEQDLKIGFAF